LPFSRKTKIHGSERQNPCHRRDRHKRRPFNGLDDLSGTLESVYDARFLCRPLGDCAMHKEYAKSGL
jgi:hypothetical protein